MSIDASTECMFFTVEYIQVSTVMHVCFSRVERMPHGGGRVAIFTPAQETLIVDMVRENNTIRLREIRDRVIADNVNFENIDNVSLATIDRVLQRQRVRMKQAYRVPFERNSDRIKDLRYEYVQVSIYPCSQYSGCTYCVAQWPTVLLYNTVLLC